MSTLKVNTISGVVDLINGAKIGGASVLQGYTESSTEPSSPSTGDYWYDTANDKLYRYIDDIFKEFTVGGSASFMGARGFNAGGYSNTAPTGATSRIDHFNISGSSYSATDHGDLVVSVYNATKEGMSNGTRALKAGGYSSGWTDHIEYWTCATTGNATDFGDTSAGFDEGTSCTDSLRGVIHLGTYDNAGVATNGNILEYITLATTGNSTDFGDLLAATEGKCAISNATRGLFCGGDDTGIKNSIDYITIQTTGNAADFANLIVNRDRGSATQDETRGVIIGTDETATYAEIEYLTVATLGTGADFGDMSVGRRETSSCSDGTYGVTMGGTSTAATTNIVDKITIQTTGNATDFGDLYANIDGGTGCSGNAA